jgi:hypothetical protein
MSGEHLGQQLHDKTTRGDALSAEEKAQLEDWYARHDREEVAALTSALLPQSNTRLQAQVDAAVAQLLTVTQRIQTLAAENDAVRGEVASLQRQLAQRPEKQPA